MSFVETVRTTRDGDQFHYYWAARRCLHLLSPIDGPIAVTVEGPSLKEGEVVAATGEEVIDVGEYYGSENLKTAARVRYLQLKHSTRRITTPWRPSELEHTLHAFAARFGAMGQDIDRRKVTFEFISNRPVSDAVRLTVDQLGRGRTPDEAALAAKLVGYTQLSDEEARAFYAQVRLATDEPDFIAQRAIFEQEAKAYLSDTDLNAPTLLKELVAWKATSAEETNRSIRREDVLLKWGVAVEDLYPAQSLIEVRVKPVARAQYGILAGEIEAASEPLLIHAAAGVGKSVLSVCLGALMPPGSVTITYDCYGGGFYRQRGKSRHRPADALIQVANELAALGLCAPLIPAGRPQTKSLLRSFHDRLAQAAKLIRSQVSTALLTVVFDAVDNAEMAANEFQDGRSFAFDLLRETVPDGVRIVMLCRPERRDLLEPPSRVVQRALEPFTPDETLAHLRARFPKATEADGAEFHRLSSHNPRVQANALAIGLSLHDTLKSLGPDPKTVDDTISRQLEIALAEVKSDAGHDPAALDRLCAAIAVLRPLIPIRFLAELSGLTQDAIVSFAIDFAGGRPLMVVGEDAIQFRDEPVEDWFRRRYRPTPVDLRPIIAVLKPYARASAYVASNLPELLLEADRFEDLVELALSEQDPSCARTSQTREIEVQRLTFALRAAIQLKRWPEAVKLALRAGQENAGEKREQELLQDQYDLSARFFEPALLQEAVAKRRVSTRWTGVRYAYEAAIMSEAPSLKMDARSRLRMSYDWLNALFRQPASERSNDQLKIEDISALIFTEFNLHGASQAAHALMSWSPASIRIDLARALARRLMDHGRWTDLEAFMAAADARKFGPILAGGLEELCRIGRMAPVSATEQAWALGFGKRNIPTDTNNYGADTSVSTVLAVAEGAVVHGLASHAQIVGRLKRRFPSRSDRSVGSRFRDGRGDWLRLYVLRAALEGKTLEPIDVAPEQIRKALTSKEQHRGDTHEVREFKRIVGALLPWWRLRAQQLLAIGSGETLDLASLIDAACKASTASRDPYAEAGYDLDDQIATIWFEILVRGAAPGLLDAFKAWAASNARPLFPSTLVQLARVAARAPGFHDFAYACAKEAADLYAKEHTETAESRLSANIAICRALLALDAAEAQSYYDEASEIAVQVGDEAYSRWSALTCLANATEGDSGATEDHQKLAIRFARCAEFARDHLDKHFSAKDALDSLVALSPAAAIAIQAHWLDRDVGYFGDQLPGLIDGLVKRRKIGGVLASAFLCVKGYWDYSNILAAADREAVGEERRTLAQALLHYLPLADLSVRSWTPLQGFFADDPAFGKAVAAGETQARYAERNNSSSSHLNRVRAKPELRKWKRVFEGLDLATAEGLSEALRRCRSAAGPGDLAKFWGKAIQNTTIGQEAAVIAAMGKLDLGAFELREILTNIPESWLTRRAPKIALTTLADSIVRRDWQSISRGHRWDITPVKLIERNTNLTAVDIFTAAVEAAGTDGDFGGPDYIFRLVDLMAGKLTPAEASQALSYGLGLMERSIHPTYGELWTPARCVPDDVEAALAGLIWIALGSPTAGRRWEAAHTVRLLLAFPATRCVERLAELATGASPALFHAAEIPFYDLHARLWWLYAVESAASRTPQTMVWLAPQLREIAVRTRPHLAMRGLAARALLWLDQFKVSSLTLEARKALTTINESRLATLTAEGKADAYGPGPEEIRFYFPYEFSKSELVGLANCFVATSRVDIIEATERVIRDEWGVDFDGSWSAEPRKNHHSLREGRRTGLRSEGAHSFSDYLSMHAVLTVAGHWLEIRSPRRSLYSDEDGLGYWLRRFLPTRHDGRWISDLRGIAPPFKSRAPRNDVWRWSVTKQELLDVVGGPDLPLWGHYSDRERAFGQEVSVRSALIKKGSPTALLAAAQTAGEVWDFALPEGGKDDWELDDPAFKLKGWITPGEGEREIDRSDPWAADMSHPPPRPTSAVLERLKLASADGGQTYRDPKGRVVFRSRSWSTPTDYEGEQQGPQGQLLVANRRQLRRRLRTLRADLIISVTMGRERRRYDRQRDVGDGEIDYPHPYFLHVLVTRDGQVRTL